MLLALAADFAQIPGVIVEMTWDRRLDWPGRNQPPLQGRVNVSIANSPEKEWRLFQQLAKDCDATCVIAPEFHGILARRCREVETLGGRLLGPGSAAVELCADKLHLARHLNSCQVPTIETHPFEVSQTQADALRYPAVVKPRDGAGSQATYLIQNPCQFDQLKQVFASEALLKKGIWQSYVTGRAVSVAVIIGESGQVEVFPPCDQRLSDDGRFQYLGGAVPAEECDLPAIQRVAVAAAGTVAGLRGYLGVDLVVPDDANLPPQVVEINPRLTTSYLGYRRLTDENLALRMIDPQLAGAPINWRKGRICFTPESLMVSS